MCNEETILLCNKLNNEKREQRKNNGYNKFMELMINGNFFEVLDLLEQSHGENWLETKTSDGTTPLEIAVKLGYYQYVDIFLKYYDTNIDLNMNTIKSCIKRSIDMCYFKCFNLLMNKFVTLYPNCYTTKDILDMYANVLRNGVNESEGCELKEKMERKVKYYN